MKRNLFNPVDDEARDLARRLIAQAGSGVLAVPNPAVGYPHISRIALQHDPDGTPLALMSELATHTQLLEAEPRAALLIEPPPTLRGDAMAKARLSLQVVTRRMPSGDDDHKARLDHWLSRNPKARVYATLPDFHFWRMEPHGAMLNAGFGRAYHLHPSDMIDSP